MIANARSRAIRCGVAIVLLAGAGARASTTHYKDTLVGERAAGLGGAYLALSDDPSGAYYNPAGLAFSFESYLSLSANVFLSSTLVYKDIAEGHDYTLKSSSLSPAYFGFNQSYGRYKFAFSIIVPSSTTYDQQDSIVGLSDAAGASNYIFRKFLATDVTYLAGPSLAREIGKDLALGFSAFLHYRSLKTIDNQVVANNPYPNGPYQIVNSYGQVTDLGFVPKLGVQWMPLQKWSMGLAVSRPFHISSKIKRKSVRTPIEANTPPTGAFDEDVLISGGEGNGGVSEHFTIGLGNAWFPSKRFMMSADIEVYTGDPVVNVKPTYNWAVGAEYYLEPDLPIRLGAYSNNSNAAELIETAVDLIGFTAGVSWLTPSSSFSLGGSYSFGNGSGFIVANRPASPLRRVDWSLAIMGSYQL